MKKNIYPAKFTKNVWKSLSILFVLFCCLGINTSKATHMAGADLTYQSIGSNQYIVTYTLYRDCLGISAPTTVQLNLNSASCSNFSQDYTLNANPGTGTEISLNCPGVATTCNGGNAAGIQAWSYSDTIALPFACPDWNFSVGMTARNNAITTISNPGNDSLYIEAYLNNLGGTNNSPTFSNYPVAFQCIGQNNFYNHGVIDPDGDSLVYFFIPPRKNSNSNLTYAAGYSSANPLTSSPAVSINSSNGDIFTHPTQSEVAVVAVLIQEYRAGVLIGSVMRDIQIYTVVCSNTLPSASGINGSASFNTSACTGGQLCFDIISNDADANQILTMTWNHSIAGATFTTSGTPNPVGHFCWAPTAADARPQPYTFTVTVRDNACPSNGVQTYSFTVTVSDMGISVTSTPSVACNGNHNGSATATASGNPPLTYLWTSAQLPTELTSSTISHLVAGTYTVNITDGAGCVGSQTVTITEPPLLVVSVTGTDAGCGGTFGSAIATASGGSGAINYSWNTTPAQSGPNAIDLTSGLYTVSVTDAHNCHSSASVNILNHIPVSFSIASTPATCIANDGTATVTPTGGSGNFSYVWTPNVSSTATATNLITGTYSCIATDIVSGCSQNLNTIVNNSAGISAATILLSDATCQNGDDASAMVDIIGGVAPYTILWSSGETTTTAMNLSTGTQTVMVEDYLGCRAYAQVEVNYVNSAPVVDLGQDSAACTGTSVVLDAGAGNTYLWSDNSTNQTLTVSTAGTYSVLVTNQYGCDAFDAINISFVTCMAPHSNPNVNVSPVSIFPNPAHNEIRVSVSKIMNSEVSINITDILGNSVYFSNETSGYGYSKAIDINSLNAGVYTVKVSYNGEINTSRIVKQ